VAAVAANKEMHLKNIDVKVQFHSSEQNNMTTEFLIDIDIVGNLTEREQKIIYNTARSCEIGKMLNDRVNMMYEIRYKQNTIE
jgi:uncharacterized OsmC-like protein